MCDAANKTVPECASRENVCVFGGGCMREVHVHTVFQDRDSERSVNLGILDRVAVLRVPKIY